MTDLRPLQVDLGAGKRGAALSICLPSVFSCCALAFVDLARRTVVVFATVHNRKLLGDALVDRDHPLISCIDAAGPYSSKGKLS